MIQQKDIDYVNEVILGKPKGEGTRETAEEALRAIGDFYDNLDLSHDNLDEGEHD